MHIFHIKEACPSQLNFIHQIITNNSDVLGNKCEVFSFEDALKGEVHLLKQTILFISAHAAVTAMSSLFSRSIPCVKAEIMTHTDTPTYTPTDTPLE